MGKGKTVVAAGSASGSGSAKGAAQSIKELAVSPERGVISFPHEDEARLQFEAYAMALGRVAHAWNYLFEKLGELFVRVVGGDPDIAFALWYSSDSDRVKIAMLKAANGVSPFTRGVMRQPGTRADINWLIERVSGLTDLRNDVIHAPCILLTNADGTAMAASILSGHTRAKKLWGKEILVEFDWCERWTEQLSTFARALEMAVRAQLSSWPGRPAKPDRSTKKALLPRSSPESTK